MERNYEGLKVLDFSRVQAGPYVTMLLRDNGAEVVKTARRVTIGSGPERSSSKNRAVSAG